MSTEKFTLYTRQGCSFCTAARELLDERGFEYEVVDTTGDGPLLTFVLERVKKHDHRTFPFIFGCNGKFIGGFTDLKQYLEFDVNEDF